jgi:hypothetical protein
LLLLAEGQRALSVTDILARGTQDELSSHYFLKRALFTRRQFYDSDFKPEIKFRCTPQLRSLLACRTTAPFS